MREDPMSDHHLAAVEVWPAPGGECACAPLPQLVHDAIAGEPTGACELHRPGQPGADSAALNDDDQLLASLRAALNIPLDPEED
jgi:hypothetical protein